MNISLRKINAIFILRLQLTFKNFSLLMAPLMAIGYVVVFKNVFPKNLLSLKALTLVMGTILNITLGGIMFGSYPIAEEKEHHTLRVLMTSSVNAVEYFIGNMLPAVLILTLTNIIIVPLSGITWQQIPIINYLIITIVCTIISILVGFTIGIFSRNQTSAGVLSLLPAIIFTFIPMLKSFNQSFSNISDFLYSGVIVKFINQSLLKNGFSWNIYSILNLVAWLIVFFIVLFYAYRYKRLD